MKFCAPTIAKAVFREVQLNIVLFFKQSIALIVLFSLAIKTFPVKAMLVVGFLIFL